MAIRDIVQLGDPRLLQKSAEVTHDDWQRLPIWEQDLKDTCRHFNQQYGWGRAISAVQIGIPKRLIYLDAPEQWLLINPQVISHSQQQIEIWDDCMSFPDLLVKVNRWQSFQLAYQDINGKRQERLIEGELSELLQHELDHLEGVVATMRAIDGSQFALQSQKHLLDPSQLANA